MIVNPAHITSLQGGYKGYAVFGIGQGRNQRFGLIDRNGEIIIHPEFPGSYINDVDMSNFLQHVRICDHVIMTWLQKDGLIMTTST